MDIALLLLVTCLEAQFDSFNVLRQELRNRKQDSESKTMSIRERISGCWLMAMTFLALFAFTCYFVAQMWLNILRMVYLTLVILQVLALVIYMWGPEKLKHIWQRLTYRILYASSFFVIPAFLFIFMGLISQYHVRISDSIAAASMPVEEILPLDKTTVYDTGKVYVIFPEYSGVNLVCGTRPSKSDDPSEAVRAAAEAGGSGFMQFGLIRDGEVVMDINRPRARCYRTLAELNGNLCIIGMGLSKHLHNMSCRYSERCSYDISEKCHQYSDRNEGTGICSGSDRCGCGSADVR